jgi:glyoxylase-like metal-dependent hydrolase (beta-lactamase superfamily II)
MLFHLLASLTVSLTATNLIVYISPSGDCSTIWPANATPEQIADRSLPRVEIFKMPGGTEYIIHDIDKSNHIIGKARFSGHLKVSESMSVDGFGGHDILDDVGPSAEEGKAPPGKEVLHDGSEASHHFMNLVKPPLEPPPTFHPPSFGVTVLGNSHGFDKSGSTSGYVLWINGRGVMIDPPPYSSATLEREGIRPRMIVGIILTHCHADHDAGAFQKVLTGSPVVVITTPTIYKSFIRKYAALSALSPALLRHSHRFKPAIIGQPLRFQGATFYFTYTLHTIPCIGFRVEWRGRSMVFTGDHFNSPPALDKLQETGVLSKARADDLRNLPLQDTDLLLHEAGAPPIHTPLEVLLQLPERVKKHLYVVHTSALPEGCELRVAPTGTAGTIRLDQNRSDVAAAVQVRQTRDNSSSMTLHDDEFVWNGHNEYETISEDSLNDSATPLPKDSGFMTSSFAHMAVTGTPPTTRKQGRANSLFQGEAPTPPLVSLRPASSTDAWFILNLLSAVPFLSR